MLVSCPWGSISCASIGRLDTRPAVARRGSVEISKAAPTIWVGALAASVSARPSVIPSLRPEGRRIHPNLMNTPRDTAALNTLFCVPSGLVLVRTEDVAVSPGGEALYLTDFSGNLVLRFP